MCLDPWRRRFMSPAKILITGVHGLIAGSIYRHFAAQPTNYDVYGMARRRQPSDRVAEGRQVHIPESRFHLADLAEWDSVRDAAQGMDIVVHMAADARDDAPWESIHQSNIIGAYHVFEACRQAGVRRILLASSIMVSWGYQSDEPYRAIRECRFDEVPREVPLVTHLDPPRPTDLYSASKVWGEALARTYSEVHGLSCICLRIGWVNGEDRPYKPELAAVWCSQRDITQLVERCVNAPDEIPFDVFYGISNNRFRWVDIERATQVIGYCPRDRAEDF